ncbi:hypothetical protein FRC07_001654 [Ceratobasidium sp. 392]|nr:hypothetical protein FRC07_001654 [Ceratobasidium sp. 392]
MPVERPGRSRQRNNPQGQRRHSPAPPPDTGSSNNSHELDAERSPLPTDARKLTRMGSMYWTPRSLLNYGSKLHQAIADGSDQELRDAASTNERMYYNLYDMLNELQPDLFDLLGERGNDFMRNVCDKLGNGWDGAKAEDNHKIKNALPHLLHCEASLVDQPKSSRGLAHLECAFRLSPITIDWSNKEQRRQFIECSNPPMVAKYWPRVLYLDCKGNPSRPSEGLLKNQLLVDVANAILKSPTSVIPTARVRPNTVRRGRKGISTKYKLTKVTPPFLVLTRVNHTRFALSSEETFNDDGGTFNYVAFYSELLEYLEAPKYQKRAKVLIAWWNKTLFPDHVEGQENNAGSDDTTGGMLSLLAAEVKGDKDEDELPDDD